MNPRSLDIVKPEDCALLIGIPLTLEDHMRKKHCEDSMSLLEPIWSKYESQVVSPYLKQLKKTYSTTGVKITEKANLNHWKQAVCHSELKVVILFSHFSSDSVEFDDRMVKSTEIVNAVPQEFDGVLDLCVCHPVSLVEKIRVERPNCLSKFIDHTATPIIWMHFYAVLFQLLRQEELTYMQALEKTIFAFFST